MSHYSSPLQTTTLLTSLHWEHAGSGGGGGGQEARGAPTQEPRGGQGVPPQEERVH